MTAVKFAVVLAVGLAVATTGIAMAGQRRPYGVTDQQLVDLVDRIDAHSRIFLASVDRAGYRRPVTGGVDANQFDRFLQSFEQATNLLRTRANVGQSDTTDASDVLTRAASIDDFMMRYHANTSARRDWEALRTDMNELAGAYGITWTSTTVSRNIPSRLDRYRLTGTYQLEAGQGDDPRRAAELAVRAVPSDRRQETYQRVLARLDAPERIAIERNANRVTLASTRGVQVTVEADGRDHVERWSADQTMNTRATLEGERLVVVTTGNRGSGFTVTLDPTDDGRSLQLTRTIDDEDLRQPVTVRSSYRRLWDQARWDLDATARQEPYVNTGSPADAVLVPGGTRFVALLDNALSTTNAREGDRYTMTARSPSQFEGAVIQGFVSDVSGSGQLTGRAGMTLNLQSIRLRNGYSYPFDGVIEAVRTPDGDAVIVESKGSINDDESQTRKTVERSAIGAAIGGIIGAMTGGGKGAAIGAVIGAGGGAGTVMIQGRNQLELQRGTEVTVTSGSTTGQGVSGGSRNSP